MIKSATPWFIVDDVDETVAWYAKVFRAKLQHSVPRNPPFQWVSLLLGEVEIMVSGKSESQEWYSEGVNVAQAPANSIAYMYVNDIDDLWKQTKDTVQVLMPPTDQYYGVREYALRDPFGFVIIFAQEGIEATCQSAQ